MRILHIWNQIHSIELPPTLAAIFDKHITVQLRQKLTFNALKKKCWYLIIRNKKNINFILILSHYEIKYIPDFKCNPSIFWLTIYFT